MSYTQRSTNLFRNWIENMMCACGSPDTVDDESTGLGDSFDVVDASIHRNNTLRMGNNTKTPLESMIRRRSSFEEQQQQQDAEHDDDKEEDDAIREAPPPSRNFNDNNHNNNHKSLLIKKKGKTCDLQVLPPSPTNTYTTVSLSFEDGESASCDLDSTFSTEIVSHVVVLPFRKRQRDSSPPAAAEDAPYRHLLRMKPQNYMHFSEGQQEEDCAEDNYYCLGELTYLRPVLYSDESILQQPPMIPELK
jgi:hypothetical protein